MNARGKKLTDFEDFKSEFFKIIQYNDDLKNEVKDKIEYDWVKLLWNYKPKDEYVIDKPFMSYLSFVTEMIYYDKIAKFRSKEKYVDDFLNFDLLNKIYSKKENLEFLIFSLDIIGNIKKDKAQILWNGETLEMIFRNIISKRLDINQSFIFYMMLVYRFNKKEENNLYDFLRVVRNLAENTEDKSKREWRRLLNSLYNLMSDDNVYNLLCDDKFDLGKELIGFRQSQREEEVFKSQLFRDLPKTKDLIFEMEDNGLLKGHLTNFLKIPFVDSKKGFERLKLNRIIYDMKRFEKLSSVYKSYKDLSTEDFRPVWGNFLNTGLYFLIIEGWKTRLVFDDKNYKDHPSILMFAKELKESTLNLKSFIIDKQKSFIKQLSAEYLDFSAIDEAKKQLYVYYIINERVLENQNPFNFFKRRFLNFGWLEKEDGYQSLYKNGIKEIHVDDDFAINEDDEKENPIFQLYNKQFRYNLGLKKENALDIEISDKDLNVDYFRQIIAWAEN